MAAPVLERRCFSMAAKLKLAHGVVLKGRGAVDHRIHMAHG
jgi:hypothetical protein